MGEEVEEEEMLRAEMKKIEARKKEREKKTQDLQKLIAQADSSGNKNNSPSDKKAMKKKLLANGQSKSPTKEQMDTGGIKFPDFKASGTSLRSQRKITSNCRPEKGQGHRSNVEGS